MFWHKRHKCHIYVMIDCHKCRVIGNLKRYLYAKINSQIKDKLYLFKPRKRDTIELSDIMIINKTDYLRIRKYIQSLCLDNVKELCEKTGLTEYETCLAIHTNRNETRIYSSMALGVCESKVSKDKNRAFKRIKDYLIKNNIPY